MQQNPDQKAIASLPFDVLVAVAGFLDHKQLVTLGLVCKNWHSVSLTEGLWESLYKRVFDDQTYLYKKHKAESQAWHPSKDAPSFWKPIYADEFYDGSTEVLWLPPDRPPQQEINGTLADQKNLSTTGILGCVTLLGRDGTGKSAITHHVMTNRFWEDYDVEIEEMFRKVVPLPPGGDVTYIIDFYDTAGKNATFEGSDLASSGDCFILCFSITNTEDFDEIDKLVIRVNDFAKKRSKPWVKMILCGTKCDLWKERQVTTKEAIAKAQKYGIPYFECSSKSSVGMFHPHYLGAQEIMVAKLKHFESYKKKERVKPCCVQ